MTLAEFLQKRAAEINHPDRLKHREKWTDSLERLFDQIEDWIADSDPTGILSVWREMFEVVDAPMGMYLAPGLLISLGENTVSFHPSGYAAAGQIELAGGQIIMGKGRVDLLDPVRRYTLFRVTQDDRDDWYVLDGRWRASPFDRESLEAMLKDVL